MRCYERHAKVGTFDLLTATSQEEHLEIWFWKYNKGKTHNIKRKREIKLLDQVFQEYEQ